MRYSIHDGSKHKLLKNNNQKPKIVDILSNIN